MGHITIGPEFFAKSKREYADWYWAFAREIIQNSVDARGTTEINIYIKTVGEDVIVTVTNNGEPMTKEILLEKLLSLGGSGKNFVGSVGGFGAAKHILYFTHNSYAIESGTLWVTGSGGSYELVENTPFFHGTTSTVNMGDVDEHRLYRAFRRVIALSQSSVSFSVTFDGKREEMSANLRKGSRRREFAFGTAYSNRSFEHLMVVRVGGIAMFTRVIDLNRCVVIELNGSQDILTMNRDGLVGDHSYDLDRFLVDISVDKKSALREDVVEYERFAGDRIRVGDGAQKVVAALVGVPSESSFGSSSGSSGDFFVDVPVRIREGLGLTVGSVVERPMFSLSEEFVLKNTTGLKVPHYYRPDHHEFSSHSRKLVRIWGRLLLTLHEVFGQAGDFAVGFVFDEESVAEFEMSDRFGSVYYVNPAKVVRQDSSASRSFARRWKLTDRGALLAVATHEFVHGAFGLSRHDEDYAAKLTEAMAVVLDNRKAFTWCWA